jgi:hypothetical protein
VQEAARSAILFLDAHESKEFAVSHIRLLEIGYDQLTHPNF